jgi:hypothetical protein
VRDAATTVAQQQQDAAYNERGKSDGDSGDERHRQC